MKRRNVLTCTGGGGSRLSRTSNLEPGAWTTNRAFTMAEILLSLTIIGVVAAITLPSLTGNINERTWNTQRKALYARMSQAIALMPALNGYGTLTEDASHSVTQDTAAETFVTAGLSKVLKINNICDSENIEDCGFASQYTDMFASKRDVPLDLLGLHSRFQYNFTETDGVTSRSVYVVNSKVAAFETANGESILAYYNPSCIPELGRGGLTDFAQQKICVNFVYDLNGNKGPNTMGKDMGIMSVFYPSDSIVVAPSVYTNMFSGVTQQEAGQKCRELDDDSRLPSLEEFMSISINYYLLGLNGHTTQEEFWTSKISNSSNGYVVHTTLGRVYSWVSRTAARAAMCVHRYD